MTVLDRLETSSSETLLDLIAGHVESENDDKSKSGNKDLGNKFDNSRTWDNWNKSGVGKPWDNRRTWDNWNKNEVA